MYIQFYWCIYQIPFFLVKYSPSSFFSVMAPHLVCFVVYVSGLWPVESRKKPSNIVINEKIDNTRPKKKNLTWLQSSLKLFGRYCYQRRAPSPTQFGEFHLIFVSPCSSAPCLSFIYKSHDHDRRESNPFIFFGNLPSPPKLQWKWKCPIPKPHHRYQTSGF